MNEVTRRHAVRAIARRMCFAAAGLFIAACDRDERPAVVLYSSVDEHIAARVISEFEEQTGIRVMMVGDTETKKTTGLVERLRAEKSKPRADVFWSSEVFMTIDLAAEGLLDTHESQQTRDWPAGFSDPQRRWHAFAARARVIAYSPDRVSESEIPKSWMDLTKGRYRDRIVMADPRFGTTGGHLGAMKAHWDREVMPGFFGAWVEGLAANRVRLLPSGNAGVVEAIAQGEADLGMTDTDDVWAAQARGHRVELVYPVHSIEPGARGVGTLLIPNTAARVKGGPNPIHAATLLDFLLSEKVERMLAESVSHNVPIRASLAPEFAKYAVPDPLQIEYATVTKAIRHVAITNLMKALSRAAPPASESESDGMSEDNDAR